MHSGDRCFYFTHIRFFLKEGLRYKKYDSPNKALIVSRLHYFWYDCCFQYINENSHIKDLNGVDMNLKSIYSLIVLFLLAYSAFASGQINYADTYLEARQRAIEEDKPYIIIFESDECQPCSWMQEQTLQDKKLQQLINKEYIAVKVDIDDFDGYALKKYYKINKLPSILLFSPKGAEQQRIEHALTASEFIQLLNDPESELSVEITSPARKESTVERPDKPKPSKQPTESEYYSVQLGVFSSGQNASKLVDRVKRISSKEVFIRQEGGLFKVFSGSLEEESEAQAHLNMLKDYGYDGFIKSMLMTSKL